MPIFFLLFSCLFLLFGCDQTQQDPDENAELRQTGDFFNYEGKKVTLVRSPDYKLLLVSPPENSDLSRKVAAAGLEKVGLLGLEDKYSLILIKKKTNDDRTFSNALRDLPSYAKENSPPVYALGEKIVVPTRTFNVVFKDKSIPTEQAYGIIKASLCEASTLCVSNPECKLPGTKEFNIRRNRAGSFKVQFPCSADWSRSLAAVNALESRETFLYAYPNFFRKHTRKMQGPAAPSGAANPEGSNAEHSTNVVALSTGIPVPACVVLPNNNGNPSDPMFKSQWSMENTGNNIHGALGSQGVVDADIDAKQAWAISTGFEDTVIAVLDTHFNRAHEDLINKYTSNIIVANLPPPTIPPTIDAPDDHGTWVAGLVAASPNNGKGIAGIAWNSAILPVDIGIGNHDDLIYDDQAIADAARAAAIQADVSVISWNVGDLDFIPTIPEAIHEVVRDLGRVVVASAGNYNSKRCMTYDLLHGQHNAGIITNEEFAKYRCASAVQSAGTSCCKTKVLPPATIDGVIAVSATNHLGVLMTVQNYGGYSDDLAGKFIGSRYGEAISVAAPGHELVSSTLQDPVTGESKYQCYSGTSGSAPLVAGTAALIRSILPDSTPMAVRTWIEEGSVQLAGQVPGTPDIGVGYGNLNAAGALREAISATNIEKNQGIRTKYSRSRCMSFERSNGSLWSASQSPSNSVVYSEDGIRVSGSSNNPIIAGTTSRVKIRAAWSPHGSKSARIQNASLTFDFTQLPRSPNQVTARFRHRSGSLMGSVNDGALINNLLIPGTDVNGIERRVVEFPINTGIEGIMVFNGDIAKLKLGGEDLDLDSICVDVEPMNSFLIYDVQDVATNQFVKLKSSLDASRIQATLAKSTHIGVPVNHDGSSVTRKKGILTFHQFIGMETPIAKNVLVTNTLGSQQLAISNGIYLGQPAVYNGNSIDASWHLDNMKCYIATGTPVANTIDVRDEFTTSSVELDRPVALCTSAELVHAKELRNIRIVDHTLLVYSLKNTAPTNTTINVRGGFRTGEVKLKKPMFLAVPSRVSTALVAPSISVR